MTRVIPILSGIKFMIARFVVVMILVVLTPVFQNRAFSEIQEQETIDAELLKLVQQKWQRAFENSRSVKQLQATIRRTDDKLPNVIGTEVHSFATKGDKRFYASSHNGHAGDLTAKVSILRVFDGTNDTIAKSSDLFQTTASSQEQWGMQSLDQTGQINPLIERLFAFVRSAGVTITDSAFSLDYFDLSAPHVEIKELRQDTTSDDGLVFLLLHIDRQKYKGNNPIGIQGVRMKLDPKFDYLPIEATTLGLFGDTFTDHFEYQPFNRSYYLQRRNGKAVRVKDGVALAGGTYRMDIQLFSTESPSDNVFRLTTYGLTEPKPRGRIDNGFRAWHLIVVGVVIVGVGLIYRRLKSQRDAV